jgi:hypothetical protein
VKSPASATLFAEGALYEKVIFCFRLFCFAMVVTLISEIAPSPRPGQGRSLTGMRLILFMQGKKRYGVRTDYADVERSVESAQSFVRRAQNLN